MVPYGAVVHGGNTSSARDGGYEKRLLVPLFLASAFLFFITYELFGVAPAAGVIVLFLALAVVSHRVRISRDFPFLHISLGPAGATGGGGRETAGMGAAAIVALPAAFMALPAAFGYKRDLPLTTGWAQCAICLGLVRVGEAVRQLPSCGHLFHAGCIDKWLQAHATCPLCRADVVSAAVPELPA